MFIYNGAIHSLLIMATDPTNFNEIRLKAVERLKKLSTCLTIVQVANASHDIYRNQPVKVAEIIANLGK